MIVATTGASKGIKARKRLSTGGSERCASTTASGNAMNAYCR